MQAMSKKDLRMRSRTPFAANAPIATVNLDSFQPEAMDQTVRGSSLDHIQLSPGRFRGTLLRAHFDAARWLDWGCYNLPLLVRGELPADKVTLGIVSGPAGTLGPGVLNGYEITGPTAFFMNEGAELHYKLPGQSPWLAFQAPRERLEDIVPVSPDRDSGPLGSGAQDSLHGLGELTATVGVIQDMARGSPDIPDPDRCLRQVEAHLLDFFTAVCAPVARTSLRKVSYLAEAARLVRLATDVMDANLGEPLRIGAICRDIGCDWKRLERAFLAAHGVTPKRFLALKRLSRARRLLRTGKEATSVTHVAAACGIQHLGRFSREYFQLFGERPGHTLRRTGVSK